MARRVQGTFTVPCYMTDPDGPGEPAVLDRARA